MDDTLKIINDPDILVKRIIAEIQSDNVKNALYLVDTVIFLFPDHKEAQRELISIFTELSDKMIKDGQLDQAETVISRALLLSPDDAKLWSMLVKIKKKWRADLIKLGRSSIKDFAYKFIKDHFPEELSMFNIAWRTYKNVWPKDIDNLKMPDAIDIIQVSGSNLKSPHIIILFNTFFNLSDKYYNKKEITKILTDIGREIECQNEVLSDFIEFIEENFS